MDSETVYCPSCGHANPAGSTFCTRCGVTLATGAERTVPSPYKPLEGQRPPPPPPAAPPPSPPYAGPPPQPYAPPPQQPYGQPPYGAPQPPYAAPPYPMYPPPQRRREPWLWIALALVALCLCGGLVVGGIAIFGGGLATVAGLLPFQIPGLTTISEPVTGNYSVSVTSALPGLVYGPYGSQIEIPSGAVPPTDDGSAGTMVFSIQEVTGMSASLPSSDFVPLGPVYELGPEGFVFAMPVRVTLLIPEGVDYQQVLGLTYYDASTGTWVLVPGAVDPQAGTVSVETTHFSYWGIFGAARPDTRNQRGGMVTVTNPYRRGGSSYPYGRRLPAAHWYGICVQSYAFDNASERDLWIPPDDWRIVANDESSYQFWFPTGQYELIEIYGESEINNSPLYLPQYQTVWRPIGTYTITPGSSVTFTPTDISLTSPDVYQDRPPCWGQVTTSVGTGDVQITLTWQNSTDLDLHVYEPSGEEIYYNYTVSSSGGQLDRDNQCSNFEMGRPENVFWPQGQAPSGTYRVTVVYYSSCEWSGPVSYTVRTVVMGETRTYSGTITGDQYEVEVTTFTVP